VRLLSPWPGENADICKVSAAQENVKLDSPRRKAVGSANSGCPILLALGHVSSQGNQEVFTGTGG